MAETEKGGSYNDVKEVFASDSVGVLSLFLGATRTDGIHCLKTVSGFSQLNWLKIASHN